MSNPLKALTAPIRRAVKSVFSLTESTAWGSVLLGWAASIGLGRWFGSPYRKLAEAAYTNPTAHRALRLIAQAAAAAPILLNRLPPLPRNAWPPRVPASESAPMPGKWIAPTPL